MTQIEWISVVHVLYITRFQTLLALAMHIVYLKHIWVSSFYGYKDTSSVIQCRAISFANPKRRILSTSSPFASLAKPFLQSHPLRFTSSGLTIALLPVPSVVLESSIELPTNEKLPAEVMLLIDFLSNSRGAAGALRPSNAAMAARKHSSHWA